MAFQKPEERSQRDFGEAAAANAPEGDVEGNFL